MIEDVGGGMELLERRKIQYDGVHCRFDLEQLSPRAMVLKISGTDVGEFGETPMLTLTEWLAATTTPVEFFIDARDVRGASIDVSGEWAQWLGSHKGRLHKVTMLTGSRFIHVTAEFVRRFADLEGMMWICTEPEVFDRALSEAQEIHV
jgi:hypothetical protein